MDYSKMTGAILKTLCKENGLKNTGNKKELIARLSAPVSEPEPYSYDNYLKKIKDLMVQIMQRPEKDDLTYDILDTEKSMQLKRDALKYRQLQMKRGEIWQVVLGNYEHFKNLGIGHPSGLDTLSDERRAIMELKNRTNTDNASSRSANLDKLAKYKKTHMDYTVIYGNINDATEEATLKGSIKTITHDGVEIKHYIGMELFRFILGEKTEDIIAFVKKTLDNYL